MNKEKPHSLSDLSDKIEKLREHNKEFIEWCRTHSFMTDDKIQVIAISKLEEGAGKELTNHSSHSSVGQSLKVPGSNPGEDTEPSDQSFGGSDDTNMILNDTNGSDDVCANCGKTLINHHSGNFCEWRGNKKFKKKDDILKLMKDLKEGKHHLDKKKEDLWRKYY